MSYTQLAESVDNLGVQSAALTAQSLATQQASDAAKDTAQAAVITAQASATASEASAQASGAAAQVKVDAYKQILLADGGATNLGYLEGKTVSDKLKDFLCVSDFGATGGPSRPLSTKFATLAQAQAKYPHAVALTDEIDGVAIQAAINYAAAIAPITRRGSIDVHLTAPTIGYLISRTIKVPINVSVDAHNSELIPVGAIGNFIDGWMVLINSNDGINWIQEFPNLNRGEFTRATFNNKNGIVGIKGIGAASGYPTDKIKSIGMYQTYKKVGGYIDSIDLGSFEINQAAGSLPQVDLSTIGDAINIKMLHTAYPADANSLKISYGGTANIGTLINGVVELVRCNSITIQDWHCEEGGLIVDATSSTVVRNCELYRQARVPIELKSTGNTFSRYKFSMDNVVFADWINTPTVTKSLYDLKLHGSYDVDIKNCSRRATFNGSINHGYHTGIMLQLENGNPFTEFNKYSHLYSRNAHINVGQELGTGAECSVDDSTVGWFGLASVALANAADITNFNWREAAGTYFYRLALFADTDRLIGRLDSSPELSVATTVGGKGVMVDVNGLSGARQNSILRVYRGTAAGSYDMYVDLPLISGNDVYDDGLFANGYPWVARTAGAVDARNSGFRYMELKPLGSIFYGSTVPTVGVWKIADRIENTAPVAAGISGWVCTSGSAPLTLKSTGTIAA